MKTIKCVYELKQAAIIAYNKLISHMDPHVYYLVPFTTGLWAHKTRRTKHSICVVDFGVKYFNRDYADHLLKSLKKHYAFLMYWVFFNYPVLTIDWNHSKEYVNILMPE